MDDHPEWFYGEWNEEEEDYVGDPEPGPAWNIYKVPANQVKDPRLDPEAWMRGDTEDFDELMDFYAPEFDEYGADACNQLIQPY